MDAVFRVKTGYHLDMYGLREIHLNHREWGKMGNEIQSGLNETPQASAMGWEFGVEGLDREFGVEGVASMMRQSGSPNT